MLILNKLINHIRIKLVERQVFKKIREEELEYLRDIPSPKYPPRTSYEEHVERVKDIKTQAENKRIREEHEHIEYLRLHE